MGTQSQLLIIVTSSKKTTQLVVSQNLRGFRLINLLSLVLVETQIELFRRVPFEYQPVVLRGNA
jgi:hypothetical protein